MRRRKSAWWGAAAAVRRLAAARAADVVLVERMPRLGGTSTNGYVSNWEPGPDGLLSREMYGRLAKQNAVGITKDHNPDRRLGPFGLWLITPEATYEQSLRARGWGATVARGRFDPCTMSELMSRMLEETGRCRVVLQHRCVEVETDRGRVASILAEAADGTRRAHIGTRVHRFDRRAPVPVGRLRDDARRRLKSSIRRAECPGRTGRRADAQCYHALLPDSKKRQSRSPTRPAVSGEELRSAHRRRAGR